MVLDTADPTAECVDTLERRRPGRINYDSSVLINLLRGVEQDILAPEALDDPEPDGSFSTPKPETFLHEPDLVARYRYGILVQIMLSLGLWALIAEGFMLLRNAA